MMKRQSQKKLTLDKTTIATLSSKELSNAVGGAPSTPISDQPQQCGASK